jgi:hypothetical protein
VVVVVVGGRGVVVLVGGRGALVDVGGELGTIVHVGGFAGTGVYVGFHGVLTIGVHGDFAGRNSPVPTGVHPLEAGLSGGVYAIDFEVCGVLTTFLTGVVTFTGAGAGVETFFTACAADEIAFVVDALGIVANEAPVTSLEVAAIRHSHQ